MNRYTHPDLPNFISPAPFRLGEGDAAISYAYGWWSKASQQEIEALGFVEYVPPEPEPQPETPSTPILYAAAQLQIDGFDITGIEINSRLGGAFWLDTGKYGVFFSETQPNTLYMIQASAGPCSAYVLPSDKSEDFFTVTVTDAAGQPIEAEYVNLSIVRAM